MPSSPFTSTAKKLAAHQEHGGPAVTHESQGGDNKNCGEPHTTAASDPALVDENTDLKAIEA
jgi:hypothetical protein